MKTKESTMKTKARITLFGLVMLIALCYANFANAESNSATGAGPQSAAVNLDFQIVIPRFVYFRVGTVGAGNIDTINFNPTPTEVTTPGAVTAGTGGDVGGGAVNVDLISNGGNITITPTNDGLGFGLRDGVNNISYAQIITGDGGTISAPTLSDAGGTPVTLVSAGVTVVSDVWTYTYTNPATPPVPGTYTGRVTYTAAIP